MIHLVFILRLAVALAAPAALAETRFDGSFLTKGDRVEVEPASPGGVDHYVVDGIFGYGAYAPVYKVHAFAGVRDLGERALKLEPLNGVESVTKQLRPNGYSRVAEAAHGPIPESFVWFDPAQRVAYTVRDGSRAATPLRFGPSKWRPARAPPARPTTTSAHSRSGPRRRGQARGQRRELPRRRHELADRPGGAGNAPRRCEARKLVRVQARWKLADFDGATPIGRSLQMTMAVAAPEQLRDESTVASDVLAWRRRLRSPFSACRRDWSTSPPLPKAQG